MNEMELVTDVPVIEMELDVVTRNYPVIPNPEGTPTDDISSMEIDNVIYAVKDEEARTELEDKVDKVEGKDLSTNDFTNALKSKLDDIEAGAEVNVQVDWFENDNSKDDFIKNKPTKLSDFDNDEGFIDNSVNDLENYYTKSETYTKTEINSALNGKADKSDTYTKSEVDSALENKVNKDGDKVLSDNNYSDTDKSKLDGIEAEANKTVVDNSVTSTSTNPVESKAIYNLLNDLLPEATATGNPILITNASGFNAKSLKVELEPIQDLHGYDSPWVGGGGKNKLQLSLSRIKTLNTSGTWTNNKYVSNGITFEVLTKDNDEVIDIKVTGTASANADLKLYEDSTNSCPFNGYLLNGCPATGSSTTYFLRASDITTGSNNNYGTDTTINLSTTGKWRCYISIINGYEIASGGLSFKPMIRPSSVADGTFAPYSNICPINGRTQTTVSVNSEDIIIQFGQTVYGGEVDVTSGVLKITHAYIHLTEVSKSGNQFFAPTPNDMVKMRGNYTVKEIRSNLLPTVATNGTVANNALGITGYNDSQGRYPNQNWIYFGNGDPNITTASQMNTWLANNPLYVCYKLATPIEVPLTPQIISLLKGNNTLTADGDMELIYSKIPQ